MSKILVNIFVTWMTAMVIFEPALTVFGQEDSSSQNLIKQKSVDARGLRPRFSSVELVRKSESAVQRGIEFLVDCQNADGTWGSHDPKMAALMNFGFKTGNRGSQDAVRTACTAICAEALLAQPDLTPMQERSLEKAIEELLKDRKFAYHPGESFNTWGYGYKLGFLVRLAESELGEKYEDRIELAAQSCINGLLRHQQHGGGWGYYSGVMRDFQSMSFNTAFFGLSLYRGKQIGLSVPDGMIVDAAKAVRRQRAPDGSFVYSSDHERSSEGILSNLGSGSRTISSALALFEMGIYDRAELKQAMSVFRNGENYLEQGRKRIQPHSAVHKISGYYFFFGYNYATEVAVLLGDEIEQQQWDRFCWTMLRTQEKNGSWWDTPAADYGDKWGTGFAIQVLQRYIREMNRRGIPEIPQTQSTGEQEDGR